MFSERMIPRIARWGVPAGAVAITGLVIAGYAIAGEQAAPSLPARTPVQLLASVSSARVPAPMTATIQESASLGIPDLPSSNDPLSGLSWLTGTHTVKIWYADPVHLRIAVPVQFGESDVRRDGRNVWLWNSRTDQATHLVLPPQAAGTSQDSNSAAGSTAGFALTPQTAARQLLAAVGPTTKVGLQQNVMVAGQPAYQISLAPKASGSLIGQIRIAIDAHRAMPLRVQIFARGSGSPAFQVGFTSLQFGTPSAANFAFSAPPGAKVKTVIVPSGAGAGLLRGLPLGLAAGSSASSGVSYGAAIPQHRVRLRMVLNGLAPKGLPKGVHILAPVALPFMRAAFAAHLPKGMTAAQRAAALRKFEAFFAAHLPKSMTAAQRAAALKQFETAMKAAGSQVRISAPPGVSLKHGWVGAPMGPLAAFGPASALGLPSAAAPTVLGKGWLTVLAFPAAGLSIVPGQAISGTGPVAGASASSVTVIAPPAGASATSAPTVVAGASASGAIRTPASAQAQVQVPSSSGISAIPAISNVPGQDFALLGMLLRMATPVHGSWGSGRLITTSLISVLATNNGKILIGAVTPAVLYADAAHLR